MDGWPCQCVSRYKGQRLASGSVKIFLQVITRLGWRNHEFGHFWGFCGFVAWTTRHRIIPRTRILPTPFSCESSTEGNGKWVSWMVDCQGICCASQAHCHYKICCAFNHICKTHVEAIHLSRIVITYRTILNIGLYNRYLQRELLKLSYSITIYLYRTIHYHAVMLLKNCTPISLCIHTCYIPIQMYLL